MDMSRDYIYDIETLPNVFTMVILSAKHGTKRAFEISYRKNDLTSIKLMIRRLQESGARMVGFNNIGYDYPVLHHLLTKINEYADAEYINKSLYEKSQSIINTPFEDTRARRKHIIWPRDQLVPQMDLQKIHHFDNKNRMVSLKILEFNMLMEDLRELSYGFTTKLYGEQIDDVIFYNDHDVGATFDFYLKSIPAIEFRTALTAKYDRDFTNHNDTKIGKDYFIMRLEKELGKNACFYREDGERKPHQTRRKQIALKDVIFDYIDFRTPQFQAVKWWVEQRVIKQTKAVFTEIPKESLGILEQYSHLKMKKGKVENLNCILDGVKFVFGVGGVHASVVNKAFIENDEYAIVDLDVTSYYPSLAIVNRFYPEHLGETYCDIYTDVKTQRVNFAKGTPENKMLKLALNGVYGDSNNQFSPFYDPQYMLSTTMNGQFLLCMLYEDLREIEGLKLIQVNTDGLTFYCPRKSLDRMYEIKAMWELLSGLDLEEARYSRMFVRDVNSYVAEYPKGGAKRKGAYAYLTPNHSVDKFDTDWHQNHSNLVVPRAAEAFLLHGTPLKEFIVNHADDYDFLLRTKVPRTSRLVGDWSMGIEEPLQNVTRYYIAKDGPELVKIMPPLPKKPGVERRIAVNKGCRVEVCNHFTGVDRKLINYDWYIAEAKKLVKF